MRKINEFMDRSVSELKGVGPKITTLLEVKGIRTIGDMFCFLPIRYTEKGDIRQVSAVLPGEKAVILGTVVESRSLYFRSSRKKAYEAVLDDGTGVLSIKWFQWIPSYIKTVARKGNILMVAGQVSQFGGRIQMIHPDIQVLESFGELDDSRVVIPVYSEIDGLKQGVVRRILKEAFETFGSGIESFIPGETEPARGLMSMGEAFRKVHFPDGDNALDDASKARGRIVLEEFFLFQYVIARRRQEIKEENGIPLGADGPRYRRAKQELPFTLTQAQKRVIGEIEADMSCPQPMNRLLQGDVGSGKTICALLAAMIAVENGHQVAIMAPTEILAEQHYLTGHRFLEQHGVSTVLLKGGMGAERQDIIRRIRSGDVSVVIGTHALIQKDVAFHRLGLAVIDEQHRFGVVQRGFLRKGSTGPFMEGTSARQKSPDVLVMTATPIPRTLAMVVYGDLDVSVIDELPPGRQPITTRVYPETDKTKFFGLVEKELKMGRQAYIVYPLVEESEKMELLDATGMAAHFQSEVFPSYRVGLLHGRMKSHEKEAVMERFKAGDIDILVSTTVVEVGIDVPNATVMVIEHAERFGLSQLHQLRGRIGRGEHRSHCILVSSVKRTDVATRRLRVMEKTSDGFVIAEEDLKIRGPGEIFGTRQSGIPRFRVGNVVDDLDIMIRARLIADHVCVHAGREYRSVIESETARRWGRTPHLGVA